MTNLNYPKLVSNLENRKALVTFLDVMDKLLVIYAVLVYMGFLFVCFYEKKANFWAYLFVPAIFFFYISAFRHFYNAPRPYEVYSFSPLIGKGKHGQSFPSRHVFSIAIIAETLLFEYPVLGVVTLIAAAALATIRVVCGVHFLKDVLAGGLVAVLIGDLAYSQLFYESASLLHLIKIMSLLAVLLPAALIDFKEKRIPNLLFIIGITAFVISVPLEFVFDSQMALVTIKDELLAGLVIVAVTMLCRLVLKGSIGAGDIKMLCLTGLFLGSAGAVSALFITIVLAAVAIMVMLITKRIKRSQGIPFGPYILLGTYLSIFLSGIQF